MEGAVTTDAGSMFQLSITLRLNEFARTFILAHLKQFKGMTPCRSICGHLEQFFLIYKVSVVQDLIYFSKCLNLSG